MSLFPFQGIAPTRPHYLRGAGDVVDALVKRLTGRGSSYLPGVLLCCGLGGLGLLVGRLIPVLGGVSSAMLLGVLVGNLLQLPAAFRPGIQLCESRLLEVAVACMGFGLSVEFLTSLGFRALTIICLAVFVPLTVSPYHRTHMCRVSLSSYTHVHTHRQT